jgi:3-hydroxyacyl-[acyl-carrier-protein] dehydratase
MPSTSGEVTLFNPDPAAYLPHSNPFLLIDRVISLEPGKSATAVKLVTGGAGAYPSTLLIESIAQLGGIAAGQSAGEGGVLAAINRSEFFATAAAGDMLLVTVRVLTAFGRLFQVAGEISVGDATIVTATITLAVGKD